MNNPPHTPDRLRVAMVGSFSPKGILPDWAVHPRHVRTDHPASWIRALGIGLSQRRDIEFRLFVHRRSVLKHMRVTYCDFEIEFIPQVWPARFDHKLFMVHNALRLWPHIRRYQPDLVHAFGFETGNALLVAHLPYLCTAFVQGIAEKLGRPAFYGNRIDYAARRLGERWAAARVHGIVAENDYAAGWARLRSPRAVIQVIPHAVNPEFLDATPAPVELNPPDFIFVGSLTHYKGIDVIIRAARMVQPAVRFLIIGDGPERRELEGLAESLGCRDRIRFLGVQSRAELIQSLRSARGFVFPSRADTSPNAITEAHALGLPVIATRVGGIPEMIEEGRDGFLIDVEDPVALADRVTQLARDPILAHRMGARGRDKVRLLNAPDQVAAAHVEFFLRVIRERSRRSGKR